MNKQLLDQAIANNDQAAINEQMEPLIQILIKQLGLGTLKKNVLRGVMKHGLLPLEVADHIVDVAANRAKQFGYEVK